MGASVAILASAVLALTPGLAGAQSGTGSDQSPTASQTTQGGASASSEAGKTTPSAGDVGHRLHDSAKSFGEALLGGIKYAGNKVISFFHDDKPKN
jgi:hypothetical protein